MKLSIQLFLLIIFMPIQIFSKIVSQVSICGNISFKSVTLISDSLHQGEQSLAQVLINNSGNEISNGVLKILFSNDQLIDTNDIVLEYNLKSYEPGSTNLTNITYQIPYNAKEGNNFLIFHFENEDSKLHVSFVQPIHIANASPSFVITDLTVNKDTIQSYGVLSVSFQITNTGTQPSYNIECPVTLRNDSSNHLIATSYIAKLDKDSSITIQIISHDHDRGLSSFKEGNYTLEVGPILMNSTDTLSKISKNIVVSDLPQNKFKINITSSSITPITFPSGSLLNFTNKIKNTGVNNLKNAKISFYLTKDTINFLPTNFIYNGDLHGHSLDVPAGEEIIDSKTFYTQKEPGEYYLMTIITENLNYYSLAKDEEILARKCIPVVVTPGGLDLELFQSPQLPNNIISDTNYITTLLLNKTGKSQLSEAIVRVYYSKDSLRNASSTYLTNTKYENSSLFNGTKYTDSTLLPLTINFPPNIPEGQYFIIYEVENPDYNEENLFNNKLYQKINIKHKASYLPLKINIINALYPSKNKDSVNITIETGTPGFKSLPTSFEFLYSVDSLYSSDDIRIAIDTLATNTNYTQSLILPTPFFGSFPDEMYLLLVSNNNKIAYTKIESSEVFLGIEEIDFTDLINTLSIYPNPGSEYIGISIPLSETVESVTIYSASGDIINSFQHSFDNINISQLKKGMYYMQIVAGSKIITRKFVKI